MSQLKALPQIYSEPLAMVAPSLKLYICAIPQTTSDTTQFIAEHHEVLNESLQNATPKRQAEYIAGRLAVASGLEDLGLEKRIIAANSDRSPAWPTGIYGAISHKTAFAAAVVSEQFPLMGLDLETLFTERTISRIRRKIITPQEDNLLKSENLSYQLAFTQVFSAKETLYKAIYPYVKRYLGFDTSEVVAISDKQLTLRLRKDIAQQIPHSDEFNISLLHHKHHELTVFASCEHS